MQDTVRVPIFAIANPSLLCVRYAAGRYSIVHGLGLEDVSLAYWKCAAMAASPVVFQLLCSTL